MADEAGDVLELEEELKPEGEGEPEVQDEQVDPPVETEEVEETVIGFEGEEAAPASEGDSSVIRELRKANREQAKRIAELEQSSKPAKIEVGEEPTLESCEYDEDKFKAEWSGWNKRKTEAEAQEAKAKEAEKRSQDEWAERVKTYEANKSELGIAEYDDAESEVFSVLPHETQALILMTDKPAALVYALHRSPDKLEELSKLNLARAALMLGELKGKVTVTKRKAPQPDKPISGTSASTGSNKELERLEREAERTGDRTALIRYRKQMNAKA